MWINNGKETNFRIDARRCGIASLLTRLCFMDPKLIGLGHSNRALREITSYGNVLQDVRTHFQNAFIGLQMSADPKDAAFGYFSAALRENFNLMIFNYEVYFYSIEILAI